MYSSFLYSDVTFTETQWNLAKIDESVTKTDETHKIHRIDRIQTCISLKVKLAGDLKTGHYTVNVFFFLVQWCNFTETQWNLAKIDESVNKTSYWQDTNVYISETETSGFLKTGHYTVNVFFFLVQWCNFYWNSMKPSENRRIWH